MSHQSLNDFRTLRYTTQGAKVIKRKLPGDYAADLSFCYQLGQMLVEPGV